MRMLTHFCSIVLSSVHPVFAFQMYIDFNIQNSQANMATAGNSRTSNPTFGEHIIWGKLVSSKKYTFIRDILVCLLDLHPAFSPEFRVMYIGLSCLIFPTTKTYKVGWVEQEILA